MCVCVWVQVTPYVILLSTRVTLFFNRKFLKDLTIKKKNPLPISSLNIYLINSISLSLSLLNTSCISKVFHYNLFFFFSTIPCTFLSSPTSMLSFNHGNLERERETFTISVSL